MRTFLGSILALVLATPWLHAEDVSLLARKLTSSDNEERRRAATELGELGKEAKPALPALIQATKDQDRYVRRFVAQAIGAIGPDAKDAVPALSDLLADEKPQVREAAVKALGKMGPAAIPALNKALNGPSDIHEPAIVALAAAGPEGLPGLTKVLTNGKVPAQLRRKAIEVLPKNDSARAALPSLLEVIKGQARGQQDRLLRLDAITAVGRIGNASDSMAIATLEEVANNENLRDNQLKTLSRKALTAIKKRKTT
ncbi:MAG: HEAT repeat domain-containing protein [Gemmataceae bacterium]